MSMSDRIVVMRGGRVEQVGPPHELYERPRTRFVADFLGSSNFLDMIVGCAGDPARLRTAGGLEVAVPGLAGAAVGHRVTVAIRPERIRIDTSAPKDALWRPARVVESTYHGDTQRFQVELESGETLSVFRPNAGQPLISRGASAFVSWGPGDAWAIPEPTEPVLGV